MDINLPPSKISAPSREVSTHELCQRLSYLINKHAHHSGLYALIVVQHLEDLRSRVGAKKEYRFYKKQWDKVNHNFLYRCSSFFLSKWVMPNQRKLKGIYDAIF